MRKTPASSIEFSRWLSSVGPDEWHQVAQSWNWDNGAYRLQWIVEQEQCDLGTALLVFWLSEPLHNLSHLNPYRPEQQRDRIYINTDTITLQISILRRWVKQGWARNEIEFSGANIHEGDVNRCAPIVPSDVLHEMAKPRSGRTVPHGEFDEGIPYDIVEAFNKANGIEPL